MARMRQWQLQQRWFLKVPNEHMQAVKDALFSIYPVRPGEKEENYWRLYRIAIDSSCRQLNRSKKKKQ